MFLASFSTFANTNCMQEVEALKTNLATLKTYDDGTYTVIRKYTNTLRSNIAGLYPTSEVRATAYWIDEYALHFKVKRIELRSEINISVANLERCIN